MKIGLATTTIHVPYVLKDYAESAKRFSHDDVFFTVAGDVKTPDECSSFCKEVEDTYGYEVIYMDVSDQKEYIKLSDYIPKNSIARRNFATLKAYQMGAELIIMVDDDNFPIREQDYFQFHNIRRNSLDYLTTISADNGWFNVCDTLNEQNRINIFHRGYPFNRRTKGIITSELKKVKIAANEGLWTEAPDVDAFAWLNWPDLNITNFESSMYGQSYALSEQTWSPIDSQNTSIIREALPSFFLNPFSLRYDDIWAGYVFEKIAKHLGFTVSFGYPLVEQKRNPHNYLRDLNNELDGMTRTPLLLKELEMIKLEGKKFRDSTIELMEKLSDEFIDIRQGYDVWLQYF